jgi:hypothetical protein
MSSKAGVWIDHRQSVIVTLTASGDSPLKGPYEARQVPADDSRQRALTGELDIYYDAVIVALRDYEHVLLFGPGEAKGELNKRLVRAKLGSRVVAIETEDKMTDAQIVAKVRAHFGVGAPRRAP